MLKQICVALVLLPASAWAIDAQQLGVAEGRCRPNEGGPAILVNVIGLKDRQGLLKLEVYPSNEKDFLADDTALVAAGKTFRRVEVSTPASGLVQMCVRVPGAGPYSVSLLHDRDSNHKFTITEDGIGFSGNPKTPRRQPHANETRMVAGSGLTTINITMNYLHFPFYFGPIKGH